MLLSQLALWDRKDSDDQQPQAKAVPPETGKRGTPNRLADPAEPVSHEQEKAFPADPPSLFLGPVVRTLLN